MKRSILLFIISIFACAVYAQANIEMTSNYPTGYIKSDQPYYLGSSDGVLFIYSGSQPLVLVKYPSCATREEYTIPESVTRISRSAFQGCKGLKTLIIPTSVVYIGDNAFDNAEIQSFIVAGNDHASNFLPSAYSSEAIGYYDLSGRKTSTPVSGINIKVSEDGVSKVLVK
ncbi:hypothetical protein EEL33_10575 [Muribaculaceae bacterium Isolate-037 (Harlan)]|uniref:leucine-rich repeat protein n=1 Tax=Bacteroides acidifaciens TaxID=85831 RepID=UPI000F472505|nr:leucine-rich repeat protein [Bacteroides acidifaciens]ROT06047.1 hypothetical protein EEL33_10575 [Muribaculaceae bacterium Isolate-037 (Harlan)]